MWLSKIYKEYKEIKLWWFCENWDL
jgi:hypothetical protein